MPDKEFADDQFGENFGFDISTKYFKESLDSSDELLATKFTDYTISRQQPELKDLSPICKDEETPTKDGVNISKNPRWKF